MTPTVVTLLMFAAGALLVVGLYSILSDMFLKDRSRIAQRLDDEFRKRQNEQVRKSALFKHLGESDLKALEEDLNQHQTLWQRFEALVEQSGLKITPQRVLAISGGLSVTLALVAGLVQRSWLVGAIAAILAAPLPVLYVYLKRRARLHRLLTQLPDAFDLMARVIRVGQTMSQAMQAVADDFTAPIAVEFAYCYEQQNLGLPPEIALRDLARRTGLLEIKIFVLALLVQQQTGGNLAEVLDKLSGVVRERFRIKGKIKALTAEGRMQAAVLLGIPPALFLVILILNRPYGQVLFEYPALLIGMISSEVLGALWIRRIVNFDF